MSSQLEPKIASLGDVPKKQLVLVREAYLLPVERKNILTKIGEILSLGRVQRIVIKVGNPIKVDRYVDKDLTGPQPILEPDEDLWAAARNGEMLESAYASGQSSISCIYDAWMLISRTGCKVEAIFTSSNLNFYEWTGLALSDQDFFGAKVLSHKEMPEDSVLLMGSNDYNTFSVRVPVDLPKKKGK